MAKAQKVVPPGSPLLHLRIRIPHKHISYRHMIGLKRFWTISILIMLERYYKTELIPRSCLVYPHLVMNAYQQGRACREAWERQSTQAKQWHAPNSSVAECIFQRRTQQYLIPHTLLQCDLATPHQEVESVALTLQSGLVLMTSLTNSMCCKWQDILSVPRGVIRSISALLVTIGPLTLEILWEA